MTRADVAPARRAAYEVLRRVFEHDAWADRAFPAAAERSAWPTAPFSGGAPPIALSLGWPSAL
jgi:hypothetical protein